MEENLEKKELKTVKVKTFAEDMTKAIEHSEGGMIKKVIEEQEAVEQNQNNASPEKKKNVVFMVVGFSLLFVAFFMIVLITVFKDSFFTVSVNQQFVPIIFTDQNSIKEIAGLQKDKIVEVVTNEINTAKIKSGTVEGLYLTNNQKPVGFREFISAIKGNLTFENLTFLNNNFLIGIANENQNSLFFLLKMRSVGDIFDGMRVWEKKMFYDLHGFFGIQINADNNYLLTKDFEDGIVQNKNARILKDKEGNIVLMYVFVEDTSLVIANSEDVVKEAILRLAGNGIKK